MQARVALLREERGRIAAALAEKAVETWPSDANFILFRPTDRSARRVWQSLLDRSILVRDCSEWPGLTGCLRVTVGVPEENDRFLVALEAALEGPRRSVGRSPGRESGMTATATSGPRVATRKRSTKETSIEVAIDIDGSGTTDVSTGLPFFDHMVSQLGKHGGFDLTVKATGDLDVDAHHTVEDVGITVGEVVREALGDKAGIRRFASINLPLDEALVEVALDLSGRPYLTYDVELPADAIPLGNPPFDPQLAEEFWRAFVTSAALTLHVRLKTGKNTHHIVEASFKGVARALRDAVRQEGSGVPSTKGTL